MLSSRKQVELKVVGPTHERIFEHAGKIVHFMLRWQLIDDSVTPWGETVSATITA